MRGGLLAAGLLCAVAGMMLAFLPARQAALGAAALIALALLAGLIALPEAFVEAAFIGCWASLIACALCIYWPKPPPAWLVLPLAANAGLWAGLVAAADAELADLWRALAAVLVAVPAARLIRRGYAIAARVVTSWLLAVALIAAVLPLVVAHPGYVDDHRE